MKKLLFILSVLIIVAGSILISSCQTVYSAGELEVKYVIDNEIISTVQTNFGNKINRPEISDRNGYIFKGWYLTEDYVIDWNFDRDTVKDDITLYGYWCPESEEKFNVLFYDRDKLVNNEKVLKNATASNYAVQPRDGYEFKGWSSGGNLYNFSSPVSDDLTLSAVWELIVYKINFKADGKLLSTCEYTVENKQITVPDVPVKEFYDGEWETFLLTTGDIDVNANYIPIIYKAVYFINNEEYETINFSVEDEIIVPALPSKSGYIGSWSGAPTLGTDTQIYAEYRPKEYTVNFITPEGKITINCTVETTITLPEVPQIVGYLGTWETFEFGDNQEINVSANYSLINYTATFIADDNIIKIENFNVEDMQIIEPPVPPKEGFFGTWSNYKLELKDITITAEYSPEN